MAAVRDKFLSVIRHINANYIAEVPRDPYTLELPRITSLTNGKRPDYMPVTTALLALDACLGENTLIEGDSGSGKSELTGVVGSLFYQLPIELSWLRKVVGSPGATVNDIYATHDLAALNAGKDEAFLYLPMHLPFLFIDECNRYSDLEQNRIREGIAAGTWHYANHSWHIPEQVVVAAINPEVHGGTFNLNENLVDNFSMALEPAHFNVITHDRSIAQARDRMRKDLGLDGEVLEFFRFYERNKNDTDAIREQIGHLQERTTVEYRRRGIPFFYNGDFEQLRAEVERVQIEGDAMLFLYATHASINMSHKYGRLRCDDPQSDDTHDIGYLSPLLHAPLLGRFLNDWQRNAKAVAWLLGSGTVKKEHLKTAFVYTAARRIVPEEDFRQEVQNSGRSLPLRHAMAKELIDRSEQSFSDFSSSNPAYPPISQAIARIREGKAQTKKQLEEISGLLGRTDHPLARVIDEGLALQLLG